MVRSIRLKLKAQEIPQRICSNIKISGCNFRSVTSFSSGSSWVIAPEKTKNGKVILQMIHTSVSQPELGMKRILTPNLNCMVVIG
jgi:hypothetical protein